MNPMPRSPAFGTPESLERRSFSSFKDKASRHVAAVARVLSSEKVPDTELMQMGKNRACGDTSKTEDPLDASEGDTEEASEGGTDISAGYGEMAHLLQEDESSQGAQGDGTEKKPESAEEARLQERTQKCTEKPDCEKRQKSNKARREEIEADRAKMQVPKEVDPPEYDGLIDRAIGMKRSDGRQDTFCYDEFECHGEEPMDSEGHIRIKPFFSYLPDNVIQAPDGVFFCPKSVPWDVGLFDQCAWDVRCSVGCWGQKAVLWFVFQLEHYMDIAKRWVVSMFKEVSESDCLTGVLMI